MPTPRLPVLFALALAIAASGCDNDPNDTGPAYPPRGAIVSGDLQVDTVGDELPAPLVVLVEDQDGDPIAGAAVNFVVTAGGGSVFAATVHTGSTGEASNRWTLGTVAGDTQRVEARMVDPEGGAPVVLATFRAVGTPDAPATITARPPADRTGSAGQPVADSLEVVVRDPYGNAVPGIPVTWLATSGGGTVAPATTVTGPAGVARAHWTLGLQLGTQQTAEAALSPAVRAQFTATAGMPMGAALVKVGGDGQTATAGTTAAEPLVVELRTALGQPIPGASVSWAPAAGSGTATPPAGTTGADGRASTQWTLGTAAGEKQLVASVDGVPAVTFTATATAGAAAGLTIVSGNGQAAPPTAPLPQPLAVRVADARGNPVQGATVTWTVTVGGGSMVPPASQTGADGVARTQWRLGSSTGSHAATASTPGTTPVNFTATAQVGPLDRIVVTPDTVVFASRGATAQFTARAVDAYGNPVSGVTISWSTLNSAVAQVSSSGLVTAVANGSTRVRALAGGKGDDAGVTVRQAAATVRLTSPLPSPVEYDTVRLSAVVRDARNNVIDGVALSWSSSAPAVAAVAQTGTVTARGGGTATLTATAPNGASGSLALSVRAAFKPDTLAVGAFHSCALRGGTAYCWGGNLTRQLAFAAPPTRSLTPVAVTGYTFASITTGESWAGNEYYQSHTCAVEPDGDAYCWGNNESGQLGFLDSPRDPDEYPACGFSDLHQFRCTETPTMVAGGGWRQLDAGTHHTCGITTSGVAYCWGSSTTGQLGTTQAVEECYRILVVGSSGAPFPCSTTPRLVSGGLTFKQISAGEDYSCAVTTGGQAYCWGRNAAGQLGDGTTASRTTPVPVAGGHSFAFISAGRSHACGLASGGTVYCWGKDKGITPSAVSGTYQAVSAGPAITCAVTSTGRLACWTTSPALLPTTRVFNDVGVGYGARCAMLAADGAVFCEGLSNTGEAGGSTGFGRGAVPAP